MCGCPNDCVVAFVRIIIILAFISAYIRLFHGRSNIEMDEWTDYERIGMKECCFFRFLGLFLIFIVLIFSLHILQLLFYSRVPFCSSWLCLPFPSSPPLPPLRFPFPFTFSLPVPLLRLLPLRPWHALAACNFHFISISSSSFCGYIYLACMLSSYFP